MSPAPVSDVPGLDLRFRGRCEGGSGPNLSRYPNLAHSDKRGVFTHMAGVAVEAISDDAIEAGLVYDLDAACARDGVTLDEMLDALRYARATGLI